jgi:hypothetical protein
MSICSGRHVGIKCFFDRFFLIICIDIDSRQDLDKLQEKVWGKQQTQEQKEQKVN